MTLLFVEQNIFINLCVLLMLLFAFEDLWKEWGNSNLNIRTTWSPCRSDCTAGQMDGDAGWWTISKG